MPCSRHADRGTMQGRRDAAVLLFLYNTGARADEVAHVRITDLDLGATPDRDPSSVLIRGKGNKSRRCPLWARTVHELLPLLGERAATENVFLNRRGQPLTRFGIHALVERYAAIVTRARPALAKKHVSPHVIRHTAATHLLRSGVDINTIRAWMGHVWLTTTNVYAEVDLEMKAKALANCEVKDKKPKRPWREDKGLMDFPADLVAAEIAMLSACTTQIPPNTVSRPLVSLHAKVESKIALAAKGEGRLGCSSVSLPESPLLLVFADPCILRAFLFQLLAEVFDLLLPIVLIFFRTACGFQSR